MSRRILTFSLFEATKTSGLTPEQVEWLDKCKFDDGKEYWTYNRATGLVDVYGHFDCSDQGLSDLNGVKFGQIRNGKATHTGKGGFWCDGNQLTSLEGAPQYTEGGFHCDKNQLTSLEGAPQKVGGYFRCHSNQLTSLKGAPQKIGGRFECDAFELKRGEWNLEGWLKVLKEGSPEAQKLILTILPPEVLNKEIQKDPAGMVMKLKGVWNDESFRETRAKLVWPKGYEEEADLVGDLDDVGF